MNRSYVRAFFSAALTFTILAALVPPVCAQESATEAKVHIDLVLMVDTSKTMVGKGGGQNVFPEVQRVLKELVDACNPGDNVVLISYDTTVRAHPTALIYGQQDQVALHRQIDELKAEGDYTYTSAAIQMGLAEAKRLDDAQGSAKHTKVVVLLTDGLNDPPPSVRGKDSEVRLGEVAKRYEGMPWFVWQVQLGQTLDSGVDRAFRDADFKNYKPVKTAADQIGRIREDILSQIREERARREALERDRRASEQSEALRRKAEEAAKKESEEKSKKDREAELTTERRRTLFGSAAILGVGLLVGLFVWLRRRPRPHGTLLYWVPGQQPRSFDLTTPGKRRLRVGPAGSDLPLAGLNEKSITISAARVEGENLCVAEADEGLDFKFRGAAVTRLELHDRDEFQVGQYRFKYQGEVSGRVG